jgi:hypothetical protein
LTCREQARGFYFARQYFAQTSLNLINFTRRRKKKEERRKKKEERRKKKEERNFLVNTF